MSSRQRYNDSIIVRAQLHVLQNMLEKWIEHGHPDDHRELVRKTEDLRVCIDDLRQEVDS